MSLGSPEWLLALAAVAAGAAWLWSRHPGGRAGVAARAAAAAAIVVALAAPRIGGDAPRSTVLVVDRSASAAARAPAASGAWTRALLRSDRCVDPCRIVSFAERPALVPVAADGAPRPTDLGSAEATDLAAAVGLGIARAPDGGRVVVLSDGLETTGDARAAAAAARVRDIRVDGVRLPARTGTDVALTRLDAPRTVRAGDPVALRLTIRSARPTEVRLAFSRDGAAAGEQRLRVRAGDTPLVLDERAAGAGSHRYRVTVTADGDRRAADDALDAVVRVAPAPRALVAEGRPGAAGRLPARLRDDGIGADVVQAAALPRTMRQLRAADAVVLADVPAAALDAAQVAALRRAVREDGLGLLALGGPRSLSLGGYAGTALDALLPTRSLSPGGARRRPIGIELVLDRSSSMGDLAGGDLPKVALARAAAQTALQAAARRRDGFGVTAFDAAPRTLVPFHRIASEADLTEAGAQIGALDADGGTNVLRGLEAGLDELGRSRADVRHIVLLTDGVSEPADYAPFLRRLRRSGATLSTVALGPDADRPLLRRLASQGGGRFAGAADARRLPRIFARELRRVVPSVAVRGRVPVEAAAPSAAIASLAGTVPPPVRGLVATGLRAQASAPLVATAGGRPVPVLAEWQQGLGRVATWTPGAFWAGRWLDADASVLADTVRGVQRPVPARPLEPLLAPGEPHRVVVDPLESAGVELDLAAPEATVRRGGGRAARLALAQEAPSRYAAPLADAAGPAARVDELRVATAGGGVHALLAVPYAAEERPQPATASVLPALAAATGGRVLDASERPDGGGTELWPWLLGAALGLLLTAVALDARRR